MTRTKPHIVSLGLIIISFILSFYFYAHFPDRVATHWNIVGQPNRYSSKAVGAFLFPFINLGIYLLFMVLPLIDPKKERYAEFIKTYDIFRTAIILFLTTMYVMVGLIGLGYKISINIFLPIMIGILFIIIGNYLSKIKNNWFLGIRNPWTLSEEQVWNKTHRLSSKMFVGGGLLIALSVFLPLSIRVIALTGIIMVIVIIPTIYSYIIFSKIKKGNLQ